MRRFRDSIHIQFISETRKHYPKLPFRNSGGPEPICSEPLFDMISKTEFRTRFCKSTLIIVSRRNEAADKFGDPVGFFLMNKMSRIANDGARAAAQGGAVFVNFACGVPLVILSPKQQNGSLNFTQR